AGVKTSAQPQSHSVRERLRRRSCGGDGRLGIRIGAGAGRGRDEREGEENQERSRSGSHSILLKGSVIRYCAAARIALPAVWGIHGCARMVLSVFQTTSN